MNDYGGKSLCFWSWNDEITEKGINEQLYDFASGKFQGVIVHARAGLTIGYMSDRWFELFNYTVQVAKELQLDVYIYDEDGWPSGFAGGLVPACGEEYCFRHLNYTFDASKVDWEHFVQAFARLDDKHYIMVDKKSEDASLYFYYSYDSHYVDLLNPKVTEKFIAVTHEEYKKRFGDYFGNVIKGVFTDEPQVHGNLPWTVDIEERFESACGYSFRVNMWLLAVQGDGYEKFRFDFWNFVGDEYKNNFTQKISDWCKDNNLLFTGHFAKEDGLVAQVGSSGGVMNHYEVMQLPGIDYLGNRNTSVVLPKQVSSVANQMGITDVLSETFGCAGWNVSFSQLAWIWSRQSVLGITTPCLHLAAYSIGGRRKRDYPAFFSYQEPWWDVFPRFSTWMLETNRLMREGKRLVNTLVISPISFLMQETGGGKQTGAISVSAKYRVLVENLLDAQIDCELADERSLMRHAYVEDNYLVVGQCRYKYVFVPTTPMLRKSTVILLKEYMKNGGVLFFVEEMPVKDENGDIVQWEGCSYRIVQNRRDYLDKLALWKPIERTCVLLDAEEKNTASDILVHVRQVKQHKRIHVWNGRSDDRKLILKMDGEFGLKKINRVSNEMQNVITEISGPYTYLEFVLRGKEDVVFETVEPYEVQHYSLVQEKRIRQCQVSLLEQNALTLDYASVKLLDGTYSEKKPVHQITDEIYNTNLAKEKEICVKYEFVCEAELTQHDVMLAIEDRALKHIYVNGIAIDMKKSVRWFDHCIGKYFIDAQIQMGHNEVVLLYEMSHNVRNVNIEEVFETERNRFFYPVEVESIYVCGTFDVKHSPFEKHPGYVTCSPNGFQISAMTEKQLGDFTRQGMCFYRGNVAMDFDYNYENSSHQVTVGLLDYNAVAVKVYMGGQEFCLFAGNEEVNITEALAEGNNHIRVILYGSNRNLLGPHHHVKGEPKLTGPSTFYGKKGFEDFVSADIREMSTWNNDYAFVPFGCEGIVIREYIGGN